MKIKLNLNVLGPRLGKDIEPLLVALKLADQKQLADQLAREGKITLMVNGKPTDLGPEELKMIQ